MIPKCRGCGAELPEMEGQEEFVEVDGFTRPRHYYCHHSCQLLWYQMQRETWDRTGGLRDDPPPRGARS